MAIIPTIDDNPGRPSEIQVMRRGGARADDFGYDVGTGLKDLGRGINEAADQLHQYAVQQDVTQIHTNMAKAAVEWDQTITNDAARAKPTDDFVGDTVAKMTDYFSQGQDSATTPQGRALWATQAAQLTQHFGQKAVALQADIHAKAAVNDLNTMMTSYSQLVSKSPALYGWASGMLHDALNDPSSNYAHTNQAWRDNMFYKAKRELAVMVGKGKAETLDGATQLLSDENRGALQPALGFIKNTLTPGAKLDISPEAQAKADEVIIPSAKANIPPSLPLAIYDQHTEKPQSLDATIADLGKLMDRYGGNQELALGAYHAGTLKVEQAQELNGTGWQAALPQSTQAFIQTTLAKAGLVSSPDIPPATQNAGQPSGPVTPTKGEDWWNVLSGEEQQTLAQTAVGTVEKFYRIASMQQGMEEHERVKQADAILMPVMADFVQGRLNMKQALATLDSNKSVFNDAEYTKGVSFVMSHWRQLQEGAQTNPAIANNLTNLMIRAMQHPEINPKSVDDAIDSAKLNGGLNGGQWYGMRETWKNIQKDGVLGQAMTTVFSSAKRSFYGSMYTHLMPEMGAQALATFTDYANEILTKARENGEDIRPYITPSDPRYLASPQALQGWWNQAMSSDSMKQKADAVRKQLKPGDVADGYRFKGGDPGIDKNWELVATAAPGYEIGKDYTDKNGQTKTYLGGPLEVTTSWKAKQPIFQTSFEEGGAALPNPLDNLHLSLPKATPEEQAEAQQRFGNKR